MRLPAVVPALLTLLTACAPLSLRADGGHPERLGPLPPDPLMTGRVPVPHSAASLALRQMTEPAALFIWQLLKDTESLQPAQLRTIAHELLRVRRYYDQESPADFIVLEAWADRDPSGVAADFLSISDWEDREDEIGGYDSDVEFEASVFWGRLAERDFPAALKIAESLRGKETLTKFISNIGVVTTLKPEQMPAFLKLVTAHMSPENRQGAVRDAIVRIYDRRSAEEAEQACARIPPGLERQAMETLLTNLRRKGQPGMWRRVPAVFNVPELTALAVLDSLDERSPLIPFPLLRAVLRLTPAQALTLAKEAAAEKTPKHTHWLKWMLFMRAAEGDPAAAASVAARISGPYYNIPDDGVLSALTAAQPDAEERLRKMPPGPARERALAGFFARADLAHTDRWITLAKDLKAPCVAWTPLLARMAAAGAALKAIETAAAVSHLLDPGLANSTLQAWALHDFKAATHFMLDAVKRENEGPYWSGYVEAMYRLPSATVLDALPPELLKPMEVQGGPHEQYWTYLAFEDIEAGFRFMQKTVGNAEYADYPLQCFAAAAIRLQPERTLQFVRKHSARSGNLSSCFGRIARHWPDRVGALAKDLPESDPIWLTIGSVLADEHPDRADALLEELNNSTAKRGAELAREEKEKSR